MLDLALKTTSPDLQRDHGIRDIVADVAAVVVAEAVL